MITKEALKNEIDSVPEILLEKIHLFIQHELSGSSHDNKRYLSEKWAANLNEFTPDFMEPREKYLNDPDRESFG
jgi:hypothetical protein